MISFTHETKILDINVKSGKRKVDNSEYETYEMMIEDSGEQVQPILMLNQDQFNSLGLDKDHKKLNGKRVSLQLGITYRATPVPGSQYVRFNPSVRVVGVKVLG